MKKALYSLMLNDDVVREIDILAHQKSTNRSNLINQILAEYVSVTTPEKRINDIFESIEKLFLPSRDLIPFFAPNTPTMSVKSSLEYKYRPTVKYEVGLYDNNADSLGEISVIFRTQSLSLIDCMTEFFKLIKKIEDAYLSPLLDDDISYSLYDQRFVRSIGIPKGENFTTQQLATAISDYISLFDRLMKGYISGSLTANDVKNEYIEDLKKRKLFI